MSLKMKSLFPTLVGTGNLPGAKALNRDLKQTIEHFSKEDRMGQEWSKQNYRGGYTSYASLSDMHRRSPVFDDFATRLLPFAKKFAKAQGWNLNGLEIEMTACWINLMPANTYHTLHLHPHSVISGAYYVETPPGSVALKLEDPRMSQYMAAPVREFEKNDPQSLYYEVAPKAGSFIMFESWLRHEVPPNASKKPRISISYNYSLVESDTE